MKKPFVYIMSNKMNGVIYAGVTSNLPRRLYEHQNGLTEGFTKQHNCTHLIYCEPYEEMSAAIFREKQIKGYGRKKKLKLIEANNPMWKDLSSEVL